LIPEDLLRSNRTLWDRWTELHEGADFYDVEGFRHGETSLRSIELEELGGEVEGRRLLHLQCHFGLDTLSWARLGAEVTGVDLSPRAVELARRLGEEVGVEGRFLASDLYALPEVLDEPGSFDIVYTSYGVLDWLRDLRRWAEIVAFYLVPGGTFYLAEFHPLAFLLADDGRTIEYPYFFGDDPVRTEERGSYARPGEESTGVSYVWPHGLGETVGALLAAGLRIEHLHEFPYSPYDCFPFTEELRPGHAVIPGMEGKVPLTWSLRATKPEESP
jgi:SAM-dependent methyltransferase